MQKDHGSLGKRVYIVDDERIIAMTLGRILRKAGFDATSFTDPRALLKASEEALPDLIISDVVMPGINGFDLAVQVKQSHPGVKILLCSGQASTIDMLEDARKAGDTYDVLAKPIHPTDLLEQVRCLLAE